AADGFLAVSPGGNGRLGGAVSPAARRAGASFWDLTVCLRDGGPNHVVLAGNRGRTPPAGNRGERLVPPRGVGCAALLAGCRLSRRVRSPRWARPDVPRLAAL